MSKIEYKPCTPEDVDLAVVLVGERCLGVRAMRARRVADPVAGLDDRALRRMGLVSMGLGLLLLLWLR